MTATTTSTVVWVRWRIRGRPTKWHARTNDYGLRCLPDDKQHHDEDTSTEQPELADCCARCMKGDGLGIDSSDDLDGSRSRTRQLVRLLAAGEMNNGEIGRRFGIGREAVRQFAVRHASEVEELRSRLADDFATLWIADKGHRLAAHQADFEMALDGDRADHHEWIKARTAILHTVAEELGQLPPRTQIAVLPVVHVVESVDLDALT